MNKREAEWGPAMAALNDMQRRFVLALVSNPASHGSHTKAAIAAGYAKGNPNRQTHAKTAYRLLHDEKILTALREVLGQQFRLDAALGHRVVADIAENEEHPAGVRLKAGIELLNRGGFNVVHQQDIHVTRVDMTETEMRERITALAAELGIDPVKLLGGGTVTIEGTIEDRPSEAEAIAPPSPRASRYIERGRVHEYEKAGWTLGVDSTRDRSDSDLVEIVWLRAGDPAEPSWRSMTP